MYSANDMHLFHHFLIAAHPCIPQELEAVWIGDVPAFSHQYEYLMHSIIAMSGSHLSLLVDDPRCKMALSHRQVAIKGLEEAFTRWPPTADEAHAMLATSYLLATQSGYMPDGFLDCILSLRGCALLSQMIFRDRLEGVFSVDPNLLGTGLGLKPNNFLTLDQALVRDALRSLARFAHHLKADTAKDIEKALFVRLVESVRPLLVPSQGSQQSEPSPSPSPPHTETNSEAVDESTDSTVSAFAYTTEVPPNNRPDPVTAFNALASILLLLTTWSQEDVLHIFAPSSKLANVLMAHFGAVRFLVWPLFGPEAAMRTPVKAMVEWCEKLLDTVEDDEVKWTKYIEWPRRVFRTMRSCIHQKRGLTLGDFLDVLMKDPAAFREGRPGQL
ncbi:hypothetical protein K469DRAFT_712904 [Zopfia rhizophila CBS 207.26]|uniref:Uncharacterized protein n=1 Tax=Zopfia rhizophila CBS 207.26 TaxID=1314779 RepID=A0A6A6DVR5_9PEZI|nr:hypothetical protein K469DRAFT_712904 [Zopfia rhizophila CBS 207.26]